MVNRTMPSLVVISLLLAAGGACLAQKHASLESRLVTKPGRYTRSLSHGNRERDYILHVPPQYNNKDPLPLVILLHGGFSNAQQALELYRLAEKADSHGFVLVAPDGTGRRKRFTWNAGIGFGYPMRKKVDDVGFIRKLIEAMETELKIDSKRIFASGISAGGILCHRIGAEISDKIAAIAPVVATIGGKRRGRLVIPPRPRNPVSVIAFNGLQDTYIPYEGGLMKKKLGEPVEMLSASDTLDFWVSANGCNTEAIVEKRKHSTRYTYGGGKNGTEVVQYAITNQGHAWPGGRSPDASADKPSRDVSANDLLWDFFASHPKP